MASAIDIRRGGGALGHRDILALAVPIMLSNLPTAARVGRYGHRGSAGRSGLHRAAALDGLLFTVVFWRFGFVRMGTTCLTAQARGANDVAEAVSSLGRALDEGIWLRFTPCR